MTWPVVALGELCKPKQHPTLSASELTEEGYPVYSANGRIGFFDKFTHSAPVILIGCRGSCGTVHVTEPCSYANGNAMALDALDEHRVDRDYLKYWLQKRGFDDVITGSSQPQITRGNIVRIEVPLPPLDEQRRIASILDKADDLRRKRRMALERLNDFPSAMLHELLDTGDATKEFSLDELVRDGDRINYGVVQPGPEVQEGVPLVRVENVVDEDFSPSAVKHISPRIEARYSRSRLRGDEILVACVGSIGAVTLVQLDQRDFNIARAVARIPIDPEKADRMFVAEYLKQPKTQAYFKSETRVVAQPTLNIKQLSETRVSVPLMSVQHAFAARIAEINELKAQHRAQLAKFDALFASLEHRAFGGELRYNPQ